MTDTREFRNSLGMFATGVAVVTAKGEGSSPVGLTVSSFNSVSLDPQLILFSIDHASASLPVLREASGCAVNILSVDQKELSNRFARAGGDKWEGVEFEIGLEGSPLLPGSLAVFECTPYAIYEGGDHDIFVVKVERHRSVEQSADPLIFFSGGYRVLRQPLS